MKRRFGELPIIMGAVALIVILLTLVAVGLGADFDGAVGLLSASASVVAAFAAVAALTVRRRGRDEAPVRPDEGPADEGDNVHSGP